MINLLPGEVNSAIRYARYNVTLVQYCAVVVLIGLMLLAVFYFGLQSLIGDQQQIEAALEADRTTATQLEKDNKQAKALASRIDTVSNVLDSEVRFSELLTEFASVFPAGTVLTSLELTRDRSQPLNLIVEARDDVAVTKLIRNMRDSELFSRADVTATTDREVDPTDPDPYPIEVSLNAYFATQDEAVTEEEPTGEQSTGEDVTSDEGGEN